jgi:hypothetical protein
MTFQIAVALNCHLMLIARPCIAWLAIPASTMKWQGYDI